MNREDRNIEEINGCIKTAGKSFLGYHMEEILKRVKELEDSDSKKKLIVDLYENQIVSHDEKWTGTKMRVEAISKIIRANMVVDALETLEGSKSSVNPRSINKAKETLQKIRSGEIKLPVLE